MSERPKSIVLQVPEGYDDKTTMRRLLDKAFCRGLEVVYDIPAGPKRQVIRRLFLKEMDFCVSRMVQMMEEGE